MVRLKTLLYDAMGKLGELDPIPEGFSYTGSGDHCYVVVHPGYIVTRKISLPGGVLLGKYPEYLHNLNRFTELMKDRGPEELVIFATEDSVFHRKVHAHDDYLPFDSSPVIVTVDCNGRPKRYVETGDGERRQNPERIFSFLRDEGINEIRLAGEVAWRMEVCNNKYYLCPSCLWKIASLFHTNGFDVRSVKGCVYPQESARKEFMEAAELFGPMDDLVYRYITDMTKSDEVMEKLYDDAVEIPSNG